MSQFIEGGFKGFKVAAAIGKYRRVKPNALSQVVVAGVGASDETVEIGVTQDETFNADEVTAVKLRSAGGTQLMTAAGAFAQGAPIYGAASGKIDDAASGAVIGIALEAAVADGDEVEVVYH